MAQGTKETLRLQGRDVPFERDVIDVDQLTLDPSNPRIQYLIGMNVGPVSQERLEELLWDKNPVKALAMSIEQNKGVYEAILVQKIDGRLVVREGNSRVVASRRLKQLHPEEEDHYTTVPAMIFDEQLTEDDLAVYLADVHVAGKNKWGGYEQAKHVHDLYTEFGKPYEWLAQHLRLSKSRITQDIKAYKWTTAFLGENPDPKNLDKFAFFQELARKRDLADRFDNDLEFEQQFKRWLVDGKLSKSVDVRKLDMLMENPHATKVLDEEGFEEAAQVLIKDDPALGSDLYDAVKKTTLKLKKAPADEIQDLSTNKQKLLMLRDLKRALDDLATLSDVEL
jgi:hypothetical protein